MTERAGSRPIPDTMNAIVQRRYGVGNLEVMEVPTPAPAPDQVLVEVRASSINAYEWHMTAGIPYFMRLTQGLTRPKTDRVGADIAGTVVAAGPDVTRFVVGDEVFGDIGSGAYAEYAVALERKLARKPDAVSFEEAAAAPLAGLTALQGLRDAGRLRAGENVLIIGASGGVGTYAVQIAKVMGAQVTAVCSTQNVRTASSLGADTVVDYTKQDFTRLGERYDLIFDGPGNTALRHLRRLMKPDGRYVLFGGPKGSFVGPLTRLVRTTAYFRLTSQRFGGMFLAMVNADDLDHLGTLLASGEIRSVIADRIPLRDVPEALHSQGRFHATGKTVVAPSHISRPKPS